MPGQSARTRLQAAITQMSLGELVQQLSAFGLAEQAAECKSGAITEEDARKLLLFCFDMVNDFDRRKEKHLRKRRTKEKGAERKYKTACLSINRYMNDYGAALDETVASRTTLLPSIRTLRSVLDVYPDAWGAMFYMAKAYQLLSEDSRSLYWIERAVKLRPSELCVLIEAGIQAGKVGHGSAAEKYTLAALAISPNNAGLKSNLALAMLIQGRVEEARRAIEDAVARKPSDNVTRFVLQLVDEVRNGERECPSQIP